jgi:outer membrane protein assembly factor BamE (lipoprotein component of BamABCDE complex)
VLYKPIEGAEKLEIGLTKKQVRELYGSPSKIINRDPNTWYYVNSNITFDTEGKVNGWLNNFNQLDTGLYKPLEGAEKLDIGLTKEKIRDLYGSPSKIISRDPNTWHYVNSNITFDFEGKVDGWLNNFNQLDPGLYKPIEGAEKLDIGLTKEHVRDLYGSPTKIINRDPNTWYYVNSKIIFNAEGKVTDWINNYGQLDSGIQTE